MTETVPPTVSVVLPNYNHARFIGAALQALAAQTRPADEIIVIDDASTDDSLAVIARFAAALPQLRLLRNERNLGVNHTLNRGFNAARGSHLLSSAADDWIEPQFVARMAAAAAAYPQAKVFTSSFVQYFEADQRRVHHQADSDLGPWYAADRAAYFGPSDFARLLDRGFVWLPVNASLIERDALLAIGGFDPRLRWHADWFAVYTLAFRHGFAVVPEPLSVFRVAAETYSGTGMRDPRQQQAVCAAIWDKLGEPAFADIRAALLRHPSAMSTFFNPMTQMLARRPGDWPALARLARWWLGEVAHGRRPGALRRLTARLGNRPFAKAASP
ncbi:MAG TPA: glycosyltransferase [Stellaceae bacterium]|nr:glycosyltransferase [Stellaceae bacterium]